MVFDSSIQNQRTRDSLGSEPDVQPIVKIKQETVVVEEGPFVVEQQELDNHFTLDSSTNCILDSATLELDTGLGILSTIQVLNTNNIFHEHFRFLSDISFDNKLAHKVYTFIDLSNTTATVEVGRITF